MKNKLTKIALILVIALMMVTGSVSIAEAKGNPHSMVTLTPQATLDGTAYDLSFTLSWEAYRVQRFRYVWYEWVDDDWSISSAYIVTLPKFVRSYSETIDTAEYNPQDVQYGEQYKLKVELYKPYKGKGFALIYVIEEELQW